MSTTSYLAPLRRAADVLVSPAASTAFKVDERFAHFDHIIQVVRRGNGDWHVSIDPIVLADDNLPENGACLIECPTLRGACESALALAGAARNHGRSAAVIGFVPDVGAIECDEWLTRGRP